MISGQPIVPSPQLCIVLDIDETLTTPFDSISEFKEELKYSNMHYASFIIRKYPERIINIKIYEDILPHVLHHGVIEFIQYIFKKNYQLAFFSCGISERNRTFVSELLRLALPKEVFENAIKDIPIFSREEHIFDTHQHPNDERKIHRNIGKYHGILKKDLTTVIDHFRSKGKIFSLDQILLVDDNPSYIFPGQERSFLRTLGCSTDTKTSESFLHAENHLFYVAGLLDDISKKPNPRDTLYRLQLKNGIPHHEELLRKPGFYKKGLRLLQEINPSLTFSPKMRRPVRKVPKLPFLFPSPYLLFQTRKRKRSDMEQGQHKTYR